MTIHKKGQAHWEGGIKRGKGTVSTESGVLNQQPYDYPLDSTACSYSAK
ncbi:peroxiredoxin [Salmonella enterica]|nr:peroxiredoxin [Salmonella enterica]